MSRLPLVLALTLALGADPAAAAYKRVEGDTQSRRTVIVLHGGGWISSGRTPTELTALGTKRFARWGLRVVHADYRTGAAGLQDVLAVYDAERRRAPRGRVCFYGESAGGHWALLAAARRRGVDCVVSAAGPADLLLTRLTDPGGLIDRLAGDAFGAALLSYSPAQQASRIRAGLLLEFAVTDTIVPPSQGFLLGRLARSAETVVLGDGEGPWIHSAVSRAQLRDLRARERRFLRG